MACQVLIEQRALKKKKEGGRIRNLLSGEFFATFMKSTILFIHSVLLNPG